LPLSGDEMLVTNFHVKYGLYKIIGAAFQLFDVGYVHPMRERSLRSLKRSVDYIETNMADALGFSTQRELMAYAIGEVKIDGCFTEFGVFKGGTIRFMAKKLTHRQFHGFDSFEGLPEAWGGFDLGKGAFSVNGNLPKVPSNVQLHKGFFDASLPVWKAAHADNIAFMHIDCDLYSSTKTLLQQLSDRLQTGTVILFDEYFNYPNWENHEFKAWQEFVSAHSITYRYIGFARQQVAIQITGIGA
jgi:hypothetical protein